MDKKHPNMTFIGEAFFTMTELQETSMSLVKRGIQNKLNTKLETKMNQFNLGSNIVLRYEEVEQSNE